MNAVVTAPAGRQRLLAGTELPPLPRLDAETLIALVEDSGLTGRGGAGFPTARKLRALAGSRPVVVGNGMEGEPLSKKDLFLMQASPELVLDGLELLRTSLRASRTVLALNPAMPTPRARPGIEVLSLPDAFVAGQETALVNRINGHDGVPTDPGVPVFRRGVGGRATLVTNVETLAHLALIARYGAAWFRSQGTAEDPGTFLATISGTGHRFPTHTGVVELARGTSLADALGPAGFDRSRLAAVLVGGYHGAWVPAHALDAPLTREGLAPYGAAVGAGILHLLDTHTCPLEFSARVATYLASQSARQCGPCVNGLPRMAETLQRLAGRRPDPTLLWELDRLQGLVTGRGACKHPDGTVRFVGSTLRTFAAHVEQHLGGDCDATAR